MASLHVSMPEDLRDLVERRTQKGGFSTPSEYVRHLVREDLKLEANRRLEALLLEGLDSGDGAEVTPEWWAELRQDIARKLEARAKGK